MNCNVKFQFHLTSEPYWTYRTSRKARFHCHPSYFNEMWIFSNKKRLDCISISTLSLIMFPFIRLMIISVPVSSVAEIINHNFSLSNPILPIKRRNSKVKLKPNMNYERYLNSKSAFIKYQQLCKKRIKRAVPFHASPLLSVRVEPLYPAHQQTQYNAAVIPVSYEELGKNESFSRSLSNELVKNVLPKRHNKDPRGISNQYENQNLHFFPSPRNEGKPSSTEVGGHNIVQTPSAIISNPTMASTTMVQENSVWYSGNPKSTQIVRTPERQEHHYPLPLGVAPIHPHSHDHLDHHEGSMEDHEFQEESIIVAKTLVGSKYLKKGTTIAILAAVFVTALLGGLVKKSGISLSPIIFPLALMPIAIIAFILFIPTIALFVPIVIAGLAGEKRNDFLPDYTHYHPDLPRRLPQEDNLEYYFNTLIDDYYDIQPQQ